MKQIRITLVVLCLATLMSNRTLKAEDEVSIEATADLFSKYVWRGQNLVDDWVLQPGASVSYKDLTTSVWGNLDLTNENGYEGEFTEVDLALDYSGQVPGVDLLSYSLGLINYDFPVSGGGDDTWELYWGFGLDVLASPTVTVYHDVDEADGTYVSFGFGHSFENITELELGVDLSASIGWSSGSYNKFYWGPDSEELNDLMLSAALPFDVAGFTRAKNAVNILMKNLMDFSVGTIAFFLIGFSLMFGKTNGLFGTTLFVLSGIEPGTA